MDKVDSIEELIIKAERIIGNRNGYAKQIFDRMEFDVGSMVDEILKEKEGA